MSKDVEHHENQFRGWWVPAEVVRLFQSGKIGPMETLLLATIDGLISPERGCFASNKYLAAKLGILPRYVVKMIGNLTRDGLIIRTGFNGRIRTLETAWSNAVRKVRLVQQDHSGATRRTRRIPPTGELDKQVERAAKRRHGIGGKRKMFFNESKKKTWTTPGPSDKDYKRTDKLEQVIRSRRKIMRPFKRAAWAKCFMMLRCVDGVPADHIDLILDWYVNHFGEEFVPQVYSAKAFRDKFLALENAMGRCVEVVGELSDDAKRIVASLNRKGWPKGSKEQLPAVVQSSLAEYVKFKDKLRDVVNDRTKVPIPQPIKRFAHNLLSARLGTAVTFIENWMLAVHKQISEWTAWSGQLKQFRFCPESKRFAQMGREWSTRYTGSGRQWDLLINLLKG